MKKVYYAARVDDQGRLNFYRKTPDWIVKAGEKSGVHTPEYAFSGKSPEDALGFPSSGKLYRFMHDRPEADRVFPYIEHKVVI